MLVLLVALLVAAGTEGQTDRELSTTELGEVTQTSSQEVTAREDPATGATSKPQVTTLLEDESSPIEVSTRGAVRSTAGSLEVSTTPRSLSTQEYTGASISGPPSRQQADFLTDSRTDGPVTLHSSTSLPQTERPTTTPGASTLQPAPADSRTDLAQPGSGRPDTSQNEPPPKPVDTILPPSNLPSHSTLPNELPTRPVDTWTKPSLPSKSSPHHSPPRYALQDGQSIPVDTPNDHLESSNGPSDYKPSPHSDRLPIYADSRIDTPDVLGIEPDTPLNTHTSDFQPPETPGKLQRPSQDSRIETPPVPPVQVSVRPVGAAPVHFEAKPTRVVTGRPIHKITTPRTPARPVASLPTPQTHQKPSVTNIRRKGGIKIKRPKKKDNGMSSLIYIPLMIQAQLIPMMLIKLKFLALKALTLGKLALLILGLNLLRNALIGYDNDADQYEHDSLASAHYGYNGGPEYGSWVNRRLGQIPNSSIYRRQKYRTGSSSRLREKTNSYLKENSSSPNTYLASTKSSSPTSSSFNDYKNQPYRTYRKNILREGEIALDKAH